MVRIDRAVADRAGRKEQRGIALRDVEAHREAAQADYQHALKLNPNHALAKHNLSLLGAGKQRSRESMRLLDEAIDDNPELPYALVGMVTDYDCWREEEAPVDVAQVIAQLSANAEKARAMVLHLLRNLPEERPASPIDTCLDAALITASSARDPALLAKLDAVAGRVLS